LTMDPASVADLLAKCSLFRSLSKADRAAIAERMRRVDFQPGQIIFSRGDLGREIYLVVHGRVRLSVLTADGRELSFAHAGPGDIFGEIAALDGRERSAGATALTRVQVMSLSHDAIQELIENRPKVAVVAISFLCSRLRETDLRLEAIALYPIEARLARLLLSALRRERAAAERATILDLGISQSELALLVGASRSKVNSALTVLEDLAAISRNGTKFSCDIAVLQRIAETA
jgi:CRP/FNR family cyclic AMP-dependent transcriptional regulator